MHRGTGCRCLARPRRAAVLRGAAGAGSGIVTALEAVGDGRGRVRPVLTVLWRAERLPLFKGAAGHAEISHSDWQIPECGAY